MLTRFADGWNAGVVVVEQGSVVLQVRVQSAAAPPGKAGERVGTQFPERVDAILQDVGGSALVAFNKRRDDGVLFFAVPGIAKLQVVLVLGLAQAEVKPVFLVLTAQAGNHVALGVERMGRGIRIVEKLQQQVDG